MKSFIQQQIAPGIYSWYVNKKHISKRYEKLKEYEVDINSISNKTDDKKKEYATQIEKDLENQTDRKKRIEDKAKSLLFIIAVAVTAITFSLNYINLVSAERYQLFSIIILFFSITYFVLGAIHALQTLNIRQFNVIQTEVEYNENDKKLILKEKKSTDEYIKEILKSKQLNDLINIQLSNYTYASFNSIRNGIILFVLFFMTTIIISYFTKKEITKEIYNINKEIKVKLNDSINLKIPYTFELKYEIQNLKIKEK